MGGDVGHRGVWNLEVREGQPKGPPIAALVPALVLSPPRKEHPRHDIGSRTTSCCGGDAEQ